MGREKSTTILFLLGAVALIGIALYPKLTLLIPLIVLFFICETTLYTLLSALAGERGTRAVASFATAMDSGMAIGPLIGWGIAQAGLPLSFIFISSGSIYVVSAVISLRIVLSHKS